MDTVTFAKYGSKVIVPPMLLLNVPYRTIALFAYEPDVAASADVKAFAMVVRLPSISAQTNDV